MQQVLHILKKDIYCFRVEIVVVLLSALVSVWAGLVVGGVQQPMFLRVLLWVTGTYLVTSVIHAEAIPGDKLFWLTRPYHWKSLLAEKLLFLFLFVSLPPAILMFIALHDAGFSTLSILPSLLLWEVLIFLVWILPVAALAAITDKLTSFLIALLFVGAVASAVPGLVSPGPDLPDPVAWVPPAVIALILVLGASGILYLQYKGRRTVLGRVFAAGIVVLGVLVAVAMPLAVAMRVQSLFSTEDIDHSAMTLSMPGGAIQNRSGVGFPLDLNGTPAGYIAHVDALVGEVVVADGQTWDISSHRMESERFVQGGPLRINAYTGHALVEQARGKTVTVRGSVYVTLFTVEKTWNIERLEIAESIADGVECRRSRPVVGMMSCRGLLGAPRGRFGIRVDERERVWTLGEDSYSPFPPLRLVPYDEVFVGNMARPPRALRSFTPPPLEFTYTEPVSHFRLDFEIPVGRFLE
jgi:hypothetical protein